MGRTVDVEAFVVEHEGPLLRTAYLLTGDPRSAEELLATALAGAQRRRRPGLAAVRRAMVSALVRRGDRPAAGRAEDVAWPPDDPTPSPDAGTEELRRALLELPPRTRAALVLRVHDALTEAEAAEVLGCSPGTVAALTDEATAALHRLGLGRPPTPSSPVAPGASGQPDDDAIYRRPR